MQTASKEKRRREGALSERGCRCFRLAENKTDETPNAATTASQRLMRARKHRQGEGMKRGGW